MVGGFDVDGGDVVGKKDDFVGVDFTFVFFWQSVARDDAALQQAGDEGTCAGKGIKDMHVFVLQAAFEFVLQDVFHAFDDEIDNFNGRVNDAEPFGHTREGVTEEFVVEFHDDFLFAFGGFDAAGTQVDGVVEGLQGIALFVQVFLLQ